MPRFAEEANYWATTVHPAKSQGEIIQMLEDFGAGNLLIAQGKVDGKFAWLVRFEWTGATYRFTFTPLECKTPDKETSFGGKKRAHYIQVRYQMGRVATHFVKAVLTAAETQSHALFGFIELPEVASHAGGLPMTAGELDVGGLTQSLPELTIETSLLLPGEIIVEEGE